MSETGTLYIVATPIGNLDDISCRAAEVLDRVDLIAAEDTRHSKHLLNHLGVQARLLSLHEHNEGQRFEEVIECLQRGEDVALISDAGTPLLNDPGFVLVRAAREAGLQVCPIPGPSAITAALSAAGLPTDQFVFAGFLPAKSKARRQRLQELKAMGCTAVVFESTHRILGALEDIVAGLGAKQKVVLARELTKRFETFLYGDADAVMAQLTEDPDQQRGEFVVLLGFEKAEEDRSPQLRHSLEVLLQELPLKQAASLAAKINGVAKNEAYQLALTIKGAE